MEKRKGPAALNTNGTHVPIRSRNIPSVEAPFAPILRSAVEGGFHCALTGPRGTGKSRAVRDVVAQRGKPLFVVFGHADLTVDELRGTMGLEGGNSVFQPGLVTRAIRDGGDVLFDEANLARSSVLPWMNDVLEDGILSIPETGEQIPVPVHFLAFFCFNEGYAGTRALNQALLDRCFVIHCDYWPEALEMKLLLSKLPETSPVDARRAIQAANAIRKARREGSLDFDFSIRTLEHWLFDAYHRTADLVESFKSVVLPKLGDPLLNGPQHSAMLELAAIAVDAVRG